MKIAVVGSGAWGTALAVRLHKNNHEVTIWTYEKELIPQMEESRINPRLPGVTVALCLDWRIGLFVFGIFLVAYMATHYVSLGSVLSAGSFGLIYALLNPDAGIFPIAVGFFLSVLVVWMHRSNIRKLLKGEERKTTLFGFISRNKK